VLQKELGERVLRFGDCLGGGGEGRRERGKRKEVRDIIATKQQLG